MRAGCPLIHAGGAWVMADTICVTFVEEGHPDPADIGHFMFLYRAV